MILKKSLNLSKPQLPHLKNYNTYLIELNKKNNFIYKNILEEYKPKGHK